MLAVFENSIGKPPEPLGVSLIGRTTSKSRPEIADLYGSRRPDSTFYNLSNGNFIAVSRDAGNLVRPSVVVMDDVFCIFIGNIENICDLRRHYGLSRNTNEAMLLVEVYKVLRDRAPYPTDQVINDLTGEFAFLLFDAKFNHVFAARLGDGGSPGETEEGEEGGVGMVECKGEFVQAAAALVVGETWSQKYVKVIAEITLTPPWVNDTGCVFLSGSGLVSFVHPMYKVRAIKREDEKGNICGVMFQVDLFSRLPSIPRVGSAANWGDSAVM
ncbi:Stem-specific protein TSJT1 [Acorus calamus]|uniref:Stem-specific protein TSJT1 n=1 Tax=Acorus calamus TaxID=4465 RepID=A0AAV9CN43_ACOCL|nr:Stem-specific protein TSJT1 [Acorus calamus]